MEEILKTNRFNDILTDELIKKEYYELHSIKNIADKYNLKKHYLLTYINDNIDLKKELNLIQNQISSERAIKRNKEVFDNKVNGLVPLIKQYIENNGPIKDDVYHLFTDNGKYTFKNIKAALLICYNLDDKYKGICLTCGKKHDYQNGNTGKFCCEICARKYSSSKVDRNVHLLAMKQYGENVKLSGKLKNKIRKNTINTIKKNKIIKRKHITTFYYKPFNKKTTCFTFPKKTNEVIVNLLKLIDVYYLKNTIYQNIKKN